MPEMTNVFIEVTETPDEFSLKSPKMSSFEKLTCREYSNALKVEEINEARKHMFTQISRYLENIPPTKNALYQYVRRTLYVATVMYKRFMSKKMVLATPVDWDWEWNPRLSIWVPYWTDLEDASRGCRLLICCGCQKGCTANCKCSRGGIPCAVKVRVQIMKCNVT